jgi:hypothetical protein
MSKIQTKHHQFLEIKMLEAKTRAHRDGNNPEQMKNKKLDSEINSQKGF